MNIKRYTILELREKLAKSVKVLSNTEGATQQLKKLMSRIVREEGNNKPNRRHEDPKPDGLKIFGKSKSAEYNKNSIQSFSHLSAAEEKEVLKTVSPYKNIRQKLENEGDLKDLIGR